MFNQKADDGVLCNLVEDLVNNTDEINNQHAKNLKIVTRVI